MNKTSLSVALIVKNEEKHLAACLDTVKGWADEIVILDSGSTDQTKEIALSYGAKFFSNEAWPGFGKQRQLAQSYVSSDWVLWLDADERVTPELKTSILAVTRHPTSNVVYSIPRLSWAFGRFIRHSGWYPDHVLRLHPTQLTHYDDAMVHEKVIVGGQMKIQSLKGDLLHYTYQDIEQYVAKASSYAAAWAQQRYDKGKTTSLTQAVTHSLSRFLKMYFFRLGFLDGKQGFLLAVLAAYYAFMKYAGLWVKTKTEPFKDN